MQVTEKHLEGSKMGKGNNLPFICIVCIYLQELKYRKTCFSIDNKQTREKKRWKIVQNCCMCMCVNACVHMCHQRMFTIVLIVCINWRSIPLHPLHIGSGAQFFPNSFIFAICRLLQCTISARIVINSRYTYRLKCTRAKFICAIMKNSKCDNANYIRIYRFRNDGVALIYIVQPRIHSFIVVQFALANAKWSSSRTAPHRNRNNSNFRVNSINNFPKCSDTCKAFRLKINYMLITNRNCTKIKGKKEQH